MEELFLTVLGMSATASLVILAVLLARLLLRKAPKIFSYALWAVVLFRLLCPFSIKSAFSLLPSAQVVPVAGRGESTAQVIHVQTGIAPVDQQVNDFFVEHPYQGLPARPEDAEAVPAPPINEEGPAPDWRTVPAAVWLSGAVLLLGCSLASLLRLRRRLVGSIPLEGEKNVRLADHIPSPFVLGVFRPRIYLPSGLPEHERDYILLHERTHIRRGDHIFRALAWLALAIHWFNPLVWLAFHLAGKDMEMSCDEAVLRKMGPDIRTDYSSSLLRLSAGKRLPAGPLAFGDGNPESRIKNVLNYKKPALWVIAAALAAVVCTGAALATNQSSLFIDPASVTSVSAPSRDDSTVPLRRADVLDPAGLVPLSEEYGGQLVALINSCSKSVWRLGGGGESVLDNWLRIDCADGSFYLVHYWYWNGFSFNPLLHVGEDDYTTLVTYYDAGGNAGTTWQMEYGFDQAFLRLGSGTVQQDSDPAGLTLSLEQANGRPFVRISGSVDGVELTRGAFWWPAWQGMMTKKYPYGNVSMVYPPFTDGIEGQLTAGWADEDHTKVVLSTDTMAYLSSYAPSSYWEFVVDLDRGEVISMETPFFDAVAADREVRLYPASISDEEALRAARIAAKLLTAAEDYYNSESQFQLPASSLRLAPAYSLNETGTGVAVGGLDCGGAAWYPSLHGVMDPRLGLPEKGALGYLTVENPRFLGGYFTNAYGNTIVLYYPEESGPLLAVGFDDYTDSITDEPSFIYFAVDLASGEIKHREISSYPGQAPEFSDAELADMAWALAQMIQGAADYYAEASNPPPEDGPLPFDKPLRLWFGSGAGAWRTILTLHPDGSFEGKFSDSDMGGGGGYPYGTEYICTFHGKFGDITQAGAASWTMTLKELVLDTGHPVGEEWIAERRLYISSAPYGLDGTDGQALEPGAKFMLYTPDAKGYAPGDDLYGMSADNEDHDSTMYQFWSWWPDKHGWGPYGGTLGCYGLCNMETGYGFFDLSAWGIGPVEG